MADNNPFLAFDLGAGSGRAFLGFLEKGKLSLEEVHRFRNNPILLGSTLYWDFLNIWDNILLSLKKCARGGYSELSGIGVNSWNVDFGLVDSQGMLLLNPISYRNPGGEGAAEKIREMIDEFDLYQQTGVGFNTITALFRFVEFRERGLDPLFDLAESYLPIPDLVRFFLSGVRSAEETILWGSQLVDLRTRQWSRELMKIASVDKKLLPEIVEPATVTGAITEDLSYLTGISKAPVIAVAEHDTISATLSVYETEGKSFILSAGTWFIFGQLLQEPSATIRAFEMQLLNETAYQSVFHARNLMGFYILENLMGYWKLEDGDCSYESIIESAEKAPGFQLSIDVNDPMFFSSQNMAETIRAYLETTGQKAAAGKGVVARAILEGLAFSVKSALQDFLAVKEKRPEYLVIIGGGTKNRLLCRMVADATGMEVVLGPAEAAVIGNIGMQAIAAGMVDSIDEYQTLLGKSFQYKRIKPGNTGEWEKFNNNWR